MSGRATMRSRVIRTATLACALGAAALLGGCQTAPKPMYAWAAYQPQVYQHFKGESPQQQIDVLEKDLQVMSAAGATPPPGYHAHLGFLYSIEGKPDQVVAHFDSEKKLFPESVAYMDFLLEKMKKGTQ